MSTKTILVAVVIAGLLGVGAAALTLPAGESPEPAAAATPEKARKKVERKVVRRVVRRHRSAPVAPAPRVVVVDDHGGHGGDDHFDDDSGHGRGRGRGRGGDDHD